MGEAIVASAHRREHCFEQGGGAERPVQQDEAPAAKPQQGEGKVEPRALLVGSSGRGASGRVGEIAVWGARRMGEDFVEYAGHYLTRDAGTGFLNVRLVDQDRAASVSDWIQEVMQFQGLG